MRWVMITKEYLPANKQALCARERLKGEAELELEETPDSNRLLIRNNSLAKGTFRTTWCRS